MREFAVVGAGISLANTSTGSTMVFINPAGAPNPNLEMLRFWCGQSQNATSAQQRVQITSQVTAFPTLTSFTPVKLKPSDPNASVITGGTAGAAGTCGINASAEGAGAKTTLWEDAFNNLNGWLHVPTPRETRIFPAGYASGMNFYFPTLPSVTNPWSYGVLYAEI